MATPKRFYQRGLFVPKSKRVFRQPIFYRFGDNAKDDIVGRYDEAKAKNPDLTTSDFMMLSRPDVYGNRESASRAFRKIRSGETSGVEAYRRSFFVKHYYPVKQPHSRLWLRDENGEIVYREKVEQRRGGFSYGLFKANVTFKAIDEDGQERIMTRSFTIESTKYDSSFDIPIVYDRAETAVDEHLAEWASSDRYEFKNVELLDVEILKIEQSMLPGSRKVMMD